MAFTADELANIANAALDFHMRGPAFANALQERPLYDAMKRAQKTFPGGKGNITVPVKGTYTTSLDGFTHDDTVSYSNPANIKRAEYPWYEHHGGISLTLTELKHDGISVADSNRSQSTSKHSKRELTALTGLLEDKLDDMTEGIARAFNDFLWDDGTGDAKAIAGIQAFIVDDPTTGTLGGISRATNSWWRNRELVAGGSGAISGSVSNGGATIQAIQKEYRQLRRYGGRPNLWLAGSDMIDQLETELRANGNYTDAGWNSSGKTDFGMADLSFKGNKIIYDPTLDDLSYQKRLYVIDTRDVYPMVMTGEDWKQHSPARPAEKYVMYRALTWTGGLCARRLNGCGVYEIS